MRLVAGKERMRRAEPAQKRATLFFRESRGTTQPITIVPTVCLDCLVFCVARHPTLGRVRALCWGASQGADSRAICSRARG